MSRAPGRRARPGTSRPAFLRVVPATAPLVALLLGLPACDDSATEPDAGPVEGIWVAEGAALTEYVEITEDALTVWFGSADVCFERARFAILERTGETFRLDDLASTFEFSVQIRRSGDELQIRAVGDDVWSVYEATEEDPTVLDLCVGGGADATTPCAELPAMAVGQVLQDSLTVDDPVGPLGAHFDVYGLTLDAAAEVRIRMTAEDIDPYLYLYASDGTLIAANDDASFGTFDAGLSVALDAACYRVEATSWDAGDTGAYTLRTD